MRVPGTKNSATQLRRIVGREFSRLLVEREALPFGRDGDLPVILRPAGTKGGDVPEWGRTRSVDRFEYNRVQEEVLGPDALSEAVWGLKTRQPSESAYWVLSRDQSRFLFFSGAILGVSFFVAPIETAAASIMALSALNLGVALFRLGLAWIASEPNLEPSLPSARPDRLPTLPRYTVMVPMYREARVVPGLIRSIGGLEYPADRLEIFLVCEEDDQETLSAARGAAAEDLRFRVIAVPACEPRTKPKALNYALCFARGELLVIYDAEDRPERDQLIKAARAFAEGASDLACVQARLNWYNRDHNWLTRAFALEYALWFDYMLPGLQRLGAPMPLGGTSNHFKTCALIECGAWDPFNVTEDADLGLRFMRMGGTVATLDSTTLEEATCTSKAWVRQRSRWIKGYMQTWLVQMRDPARLRRTAGPMGFAGFLLFVGGVAATSLGNPILWALTITATLLWAAGMQSPLPEFFVWWAIVSILLGNFGLIYLNMLCALRRRWLDLVPAALLTPAYWVLFSFAGYKALWQLIYNPHYWEKTEHGVGDGA